MSGAAFDAWRLVWWPAISLVVNVVVVIWVFVANRRAAKEKNLRDTRTALEARITDNDVRITKLETAADAAPNHTDMSALHGKINDVSLQVARMSGAVESMAGSMAAVQDYFMRKAMQKGDG